MTQKANHTKGRKQTDLQDKNKSKKSPESLLREGKIIEIPVNGWSMYPMMVPGRDMAVITPFVESLNQDASDNAAFSAQYPSVYAVKRGDVVLFRRKSGLLVLHRVYRVTGENCSFVGDNMPDIETGITTNQMIGILSEILRNEKKISVTDWNYRIISGIWLLLRPFRPCIHRVSRGIRQLRKKRFR